MEKNKLDSLKRMTPSMRKIVDFEAKEAKRILDKLGEDANEKRIYEELRLFWNQEAPDVKEEKEIFLSGSVGEFRVKLFYPEKKAQGNYECIIFIHGGGFTVGSIESHEGIVKRLANETGAMVASVDYHLAPTYKYPVQLNECVQVLEHLYENAEAYQIDQNQLSVAGDSAGANLSLAVALKMRDENRKVQLKSMLLYYGSFGLKDSRSMHLYGGYWDGLKFEDLAYYKKIYAEEAFLEDKYRNLLNSDLTYGLSPAYIMACDLDPLQDDSILLKEIFDEHGIKNTFEMYEGVIHGFLHYSSQLEEAYASIKSSAKFYNEL
ncbi:acetyl esterase [Desulfitispora alkaliphila]|uniref:alpha/beta hydrolase fold domain-containing protein n=1 Tax=Desulfitispora alkaliphila TaxID=622674 RepID=UPI003D218561